MKTLPSSPTLRRPPTAPKRLLALALLALATLLTLSPRPARATGEECCCPEGETWDEATQQCQ